MRALFSLQQLAYAVWNLIAVASRTVTVTTNNDKTGYSLAAGAIIQSIQIGTITIPAASTSADATITAVTLARSVILYLGMSGTSGSAPIHGQFAYVSLPNTTTARAHKSSTSGSDTVTVAYAVVEFK